MFRELLDSWREGATGERTIKAYAVRLPIDDAARLCALAQMFPGRTPEQLITELLGAALRGVSAAMPYIAGAKAISADDQGDPVYEDIGPTPRFMALTRKHRRKLQPKSRKPR